MSPPPVEERPPPSTDPRMSWSEPAAPLPAWASDGLGVGLGVGLWVGGAGAAHPSREQGARLGRVTGVGFTRAAATQHATEHPSQPTRSAHLLGEPRHDDGRQDRQQLGDDRPRRATEPTELAHDLVLLTAEDVADDLLAVVLVDVVEAAHRVGVVRQRGHDRMGGVGVLGVGMEAAEQGRQGALRCGGDLALVDSPLAGELADRHLGSGSRRTPTCSASSWGGPVPQLDSDSSHDPWPRTGIETVNRSPDPHLSRHRRRSPEAREGGRRCRCSSGSTRVSP